MLVTLQQLKNSLQAVKNYIDKIVPKKVSDLPNDAGYITDEGLTRVSISDNNAGKVTVSIQSSISDGNGVSY